MQRLSWRAYRAARDYIDAHGADIDRAWMRYCFDDGDAAVFMDALARYQHPNGGVGGLVHEFDYPGPCLACTQSAFYYLYDMKNRPHAGHPVIRKMMAYVLARYRPEIGHWGQLLEPEVNDGLHPWWWSYEPDERSFESFDECVRAYDPNGQAALAAFAAMYRELVPDALYRDIIRYPAETILRYYDEGSPLYAQPGGGKAPVESPYNLVSLQPFCDCLDEEPLASRLKAILCQNPTACLELDASVWSQGYHVTPCDVVTRPDSFLYPVVRREVDGALDALIARQGGDGAWPLTFRFGEAEGFRALEAAYKAYMTAQYLAQLGRFGRIDREG